MKKLLVIVLSIVSCLAGVGALSAMQPSSSTGLSSGTISSTASSAAASTSAASTESSSSADKKESKEEKKDSVAVGSKRKLDDKTAEDDEADRSGKRARGGDSEKEALEKLLAPIINSSALFGYRLLQTGDGYYQSRSAFETKALAVRYYRQAAEKGTIRAMVKLQYCYAHGIGVARDEKSAAAWATKAATANRLDQMVVQAHEYLVGTCEHKKDEKRAIDLFTQAMDQGSAAASNGLAYCYLNGCGVAKDVKKGLELIRKAFDGWYAGAIDLLGACYCDGIGVEKDARKAVELFTKAAAEECASAYNHLGECYWGGVGVEEDEKQAIFYYKRAAVHGYSPAMINLGDCYLRAAESLQDDKSAVAWFNKALEQGNIEALGLLGFCYLNGRGVAEDPFEAGTLFARGDSAGDYFATRNLGNCYLLGTCGFAMNGAKAVACFQKAQAVDGLASVPLSYCYRNGIGVEKDIKAADAAYARALEVVSEAEAAAELAGVDASYQTAQETAVKVLQTVKPADDDACIICSQKYLSGHEIASLACGHRFHKVCIQRWVNGSLEDHILGHSTCPLCRHSVWTECVAE